MRRFCLCINCLAKIVAHAGQLFADRLIEFGLPAAEYFRHCLHAALHFGLRFQKFVHMDFGISRPFCNLCVKNRAAPVANDDNNDHDNKHGHKDHEQPVHHSERKAGNGNERMGRRIKHFSRLAVFPSQSDQKAEKINNIALTYEM